MKRLPIVTILLALLLSACAQATPTADPAQIQASAVAAANTMVALTQAAVPTATPEPPTPLPSPTALPSPTLLPLPTLAVATQAPQALPTLGSGGGSSGNTSGDPCQAPMAAKPAGPETTVRIVNTLKASVVLSLYLSKNTFGDCGYRGFNLGPFDSLSASMPIGCYSAGAFINDPKKPSKSFGYGCVKNASQWSVTIGADVIRISQ